MKCIITDLVVREASSEDVPNIKLLLMLMTELMREPKISLTTFYTVFLICRFNLPTCTCVFCCKIKSNQYQQANILKILYFSPSLNNVSHTLFLLGAQDLRQYSVFNLLGFGYISSVRIVDMIT